MTDEGKVAVEKEDIERAVAAPRTAWSGLGKGWAAGLVDGVDPVNQSRVRGSRFVGVFVSVTVLERVGFPLRRASYGPD